MLSYDKYKDLACVGVTYIILSIEWPFKLRDKKFSATRTSFQADSPAKKFYLELSRITGFPEWSFSVRKLVRRVAQAALGPSPHRALHRLGQELQNGDSWETIGWMG